MKSGRATIHRKTHHIPEIKFEDQRLISFAGLVVYQSLFNHIGLKQQLSGYFRHLTVSPVFGHGLIVLLLVTLLLLGYRRLQDMRYYQDDPMVRRLLGIERLPDVAPVSRTLAGLDASSITQLRRLNRQRVLEQLRVFGLARVKLDFDGSVLSTGRFAESMAVGLNRKKKGQRSYYPLFCTVVQTGQVLDVWHRPGNVHDSNGTQAFIPAYVQEIKAILPRCIIEARLDSAFFSDEIVGLLHTEGVAFNISVPFERFTELELKGLVNGRKRWRHLSERCDFFETHWKPKRWNENYRFVFIRTCNRRQYKEPDQLGLFIPYEYGYDSKVIITNKRLSARKVMSFHNGRGAQEGIFAELKSQTQMDYIPTRHQASNQAYLLSAMLAHNLSREMQMMAYEQQRNTIEQRSRLWFFEQIGTLRRKLIQRAGRLTKPQGKLTLTMSVNPAVKSQLSHQ